MYVSPTSPSPTPTVQSGGRARREGASAPRRDTPAVPLPYQDSVTETTLSVLRAITLGNMPLSQRLASSQDGPATRSMGEAIAEPSRLRADRALNTIIDVRCRGASLGDVTRGFTHSLPSADTSSVATPDTLL
jgi:hypothetical protein